MALTTSSYQQFILAEIGDTGIVEPWIDTIWLLYADYSVIDPRLQYLYSKLKAIDMLEGAFRESVQFQVQDNLDVYMQQKFDHLATMRKQTRDDIAQTIHDQTALLNAGGLSPKVDFLTQTAPIMSPTNAPDANDSYYRGDPNKAPRTFRFIR